MTINILGSKWTIKEKTEEEEPFLNSVSGFADSSTREIVICKLKRTENSVEDMDQFKRTVIRHEIVHAFLFESGLAGNSNCTECWALNEEMVDWIAMQGPKIYKAWQDAKAI